MWGAGTGSWLGEKREQKEEDAPGGNAAQITPEEVVSVSHREEGEGVFFRTRVLRRA